MKRKKHKEALAWCHPDFSHTLAVSMFFISLKKPTKFAVHRELDISYGLFSSLSLLFPA